MAPARMQFDLSFKSASAAARPRDPEAPLRLLLVADFGGDRSQPLAARKPIAVDIDRFDAAIARIAPRLAVEVGDQSLGLRFASFDDFHPDRLFAQLPVFDTLRQLRDEARDARQFRRVAAALGIAEPAPAPPSAAAPAAAADAADDIARLLGRAPSAAPAAAPAATAPASLIDRWMRELVSPHVTPDTASQQQAVVAAIDTALGALMRAVLHAPAMRSLEAAWLGADRLVRGLDLGESVELRLLDASRDELLGDLAAHRADLSASALHAVLNPREGVDAPRYSLVAVDHAFGPGGDDVQALAALGALGARAGATVLAGALPSMAGAASLADLADPKRWLAADDEALANWLALREAPMAPWLGLVLPRVLMRLPYGAATDPVSSFAFEELPPQRPHEAYLWGGGAPALMLLAGLAFQQDGWDLNLAAQLDLEDLPSHVYTEDGERHQQPCAELLLGEQAGQALLDRGLMPLLSWRQRNAARLLRWQSVAWPARALAGLAAH